VVQQENPVPSIKPSQDIQPLSVFRANAAGFLDQVRATKRPLVLTQHGRSAAVLLDVNEYDAMVDELELVRDIQRARAEMARGEGIAHDDVVTELRSRLAP
jgi:antitoxin YefM